MMRIAFVILIGGVFAISGCDRASSGQTPSAPAKPIKTSKFKKVLVLGCDGMDPKLVRRLIDEGRMPNFAKLEKQGGFKSLETSIPPQSPVAWSNFITGSNPGVHGIFDFIHRDFNPKNVGDNVKPRPSTTIEIPAEKPWKTFNIGGYQVTTSEFNPFADAAQIKLGRQGVPFWDYLDEKGIPVQMYKLAANYPPSESKEGHMCCLAGMGVPDALATLGTYQHFTNEPRATNDLGGGRQDRLRRDFKDGSFVATLRGPKNEYLPPSLRTDEPPDMELDLRIFRDPVNPCVKIKWVNEGIAANETKEVVMNEGEWSDWHDVNFLKTPVGPSVPAMVRFYLQEVSNQRIRLYVSPLNFIPANSAAVISEPPDFVEEIGEGIGPFYTQGFAESFKARHYKDLDDAEYKRQADIVLDESMKMLDYALERYVDGVLFFYFSSTDLQSHIFWWDSDRPHPFRSPDDAKKYNDAVAKVYEQMDVALGRCMASMGDDATYIVMSDHGFGNFRRQFGLNTWLRENGYLFSTDDVFSDKTDWTRSKAYGLGINGLYLNLEGREKLGIVNMADRPALLKEITEKLLAYVDPDEPGVHPIRRVYRTNKSYSGKQKKNAPDLIIGYEKDYRSSWQTGLGHFDKTVTSDNTEAWSADHCIAHELVPGILLCNRQIQMEAPALIDVAPSILAEFGIATPSTMEGRSFLPQASGSTP